MFKRITSLDKYEINPKLSTSSFKDIEFYLFGKKYYFYDDEWMHHVHLKVTSKCNASCNFCIEKDSIVKENKENFLNNLNELLVQMNDQKVLKTISITGGEPSLCSYLPDVMNIISKYNVFSSINTNGLNIENLTNFPTWINISKHNIDDSSIFKSDNLSITKIKDIKEKSNSKVRLQCVLQKDGVNNVDSLLNYMNYFKSVVDDFSFRQLIKTSDNYDDQPTLEFFREYLYNNGIFIEQTFQDYYVYENWILNNIPITISFSDMNLLKHSEKIEENNILREIIVHPDGLISGDWDRKNKIIKY